MSIVLRLLPPIVLLCILCSTTSSFADKPAVLSRIAFGSCAKQDRPQPIWEAVVESQPQLFLMIGDNIYGDTDDMELLWKKYQMLDAQPGFQKLRATCPVMGTWDDHDYGVNDGGVEFPKKRESQQLCLDFFQVPKDSPRRQREGVYHAEVFGPPGKRVQIILTDSRYFRSPLKRSTKKAEPGEGYRRPAPHSGGSPHLRIQCPGTADRTRLGNVGPVSARTPATAEPDP
jgi:alkaline phosphatase D